jgi:protein-L-isoaspartate(D-aspartate) O-methyltransferase
MFRHKELTPSPPQEDERAVTANFSVMPRDIAEAKAALVLQLRSRGIRDLALLRAMEKVPRDIFVPHRYADLAARELSIPIGCGQTLSEPWLVARMIETLALAPHHRVLEIGTGSGYATAVLAAIVQTSVTSVERFHSLAIAARLRLESIGVANATIIVGDGLAMAADSGPFDRILVHGSVEELPPALAGVLAANGRIVLGKPDPAAKQRQILVEITRGGDGSLTERARGACRLQPLMPGLARII